MIDREATERMEDADAHIHELEAKCAAMREAMESCLTFTACLPSIPEAHRESVKMRAAISGDAGRALLERVEALERVATAARVVKKHGYFGDDASNLDASVDILDALELKR